MTDLDLLDDIPGDKPVLVVAEGLTPYLRADDGVAMLRRISEHFPSGEMIFDGYSRSGVWILQRYGPVKASGAQLDWTIGDPHGLERAVPGSGVRRRMVVPTRPGDRAPVSPALPSTTPDPLQLHGDTTTRPGPVLLLRTHGA